MVEAVLVLDSLGDAFMPSVSRLREPTAEAQRQV
jgi:hypothetical protein